MSGRCCARYRAELLQTAEQVTPRVDAKALVSVRQNRYSVPVALAGLRVIATIGAREITIAHGGRQVARHDRLVGRFGTSAQLDHYLELLARKPAALIGSLALGQQRDRGEWPDCFDELWARIAERYGRSEAARQMVDVLMLCREHGPARRPARRSRRAGGRRARRPRCRGPRPPNGRQRDARTTDRPRPAVGRARASRPGSRRLRPTARRPTMTPANAKTAAWRR